MIAGQGPNLDPWINQLYMLGDSALITKDFCFCLLRMPSAMQLVCYTQRRREGGGGAEGATHPQCFASSTIIYFMMYVFNRYLASNVAQTIMFEA
jgi:hypothetical protein